jgi:hypothetical protein
MEDTNSYDDIDELRKELGISIHNNSDEEEQQYLRTCDLCYVLYARDETHECGKPSKPREKQCDKCKVFYTNLETHRCGSIKVINNDKEQMRCLVCKNYYPLEETHRCKLANIRPECPICHETYRTEHKCDFNKPHKYTCGGCNEDYYSEDEHDCGYVD